MPIKVDIVTRDRRLISDEVDMVTLPGTSGQMGVLRGHALLGTQRLESARRGSHRRRTAAAPGCPGEIRSASRVAVRGRRDLR